MIETLKLMNSMICHDEKLPYEEIAEGYRLTRHPSLLALSFKRTFKFTIQLSSYFYGLDESDIASISLEILDKTLQTYDPSKGMKFTSFYAQNLNFRLRAETESLNTAKRKAMFFQDNIEDNAGIKADGVELNFAFTDYLESAGFTQKELEYSNLLLHSYTNKEIAGYFKTSVMKLCKMRKDMREKISSQNGYELANFSI